MSLSTLPAGLRGLSSAEAARRLALHGPNTLPSAEPERWWRRLLRQLQSPLVYILCVALVLDLVFWLRDSHGIPFESIAIAAILVLNAGLGVWQERKAEDALARLNQLAAPQVWAVRDGELERLPGSDLVPGDLVRVESGDRVPADARVVQAENLSLDESLLTGESLPVERASEAEVFSGTLVLRGRAWLEVRRTGARSAMGRIASMLGGIREEPTPLERRLTGFGRIVARVVLLVAAVIVIGGLVLEDPGRMGEVLVFAVSLAVAAVPEGLPAVLTLTLALGVQRMARRKAVVRRLSAVEALGSVTVIVTDKTGTLTENRLHVHELDAADREEALRAMVLANDAEAGSAAGDPLELALLTYAQAAGHDPEELRVRFPRDSSRSFDSAWRYMRATVLRGSQPVSYLKGAPEVILSRSRLDPAERARWERRIETSSEQGFRLLGLARGEGVAETDLTWLGLVMFWDPPRPEVGPAQAAVRASGVRVIMMTGDHPATAVTLGRTVGLPDGEVITGPELDLMDDAQLRDRLPRVAVIARALPEHKLRVVEALQAGGDIVAMTGDGVNDAPALKRADVGVAMGQRGSAVSREVADLVLLDDNFATLTDAIREGRSIYENVQKFIRFLLATNLAEVIVVGTGFFAAYLMDLRVADGGLLLPLTAAQLLWINLVTDGAPALALGLDRNPGVMEHPPRAPGAPLLDRPSVRFLFLAALTASAIAGLMLVFLPGAGYSLEQTRTAMFVFLASAQLVFALSARHTDVRPLPNRVLVAAILVGLGLILVTLLPGVPRDAFGTAALDPAGFLVIGLGVMVAWLVTEVGSRVIWSKGGRTVGR